MNKSKATAKKSKSSSMSKSVSKKSSSDKISSTKNKSVQDSTEMGYRDLVLGTISAISTYIFALWAIDSGSLWVYALTFAALYYTLHFYRLFIGNKFFNNDKKSKAK